MKVLLGVSGAMAAMQLPVLGKALLEAGHELQIVMTDDAYQFVNPHSTHDCFTIPFVERMAALSTTPPIPVVGYDVWKQVKIWRNDDARFDKRKPLLRVELRDWADVLLVAPCSASTLAKFALGLPDDLLTSIFYAWVFESWKPILLAPAMDQFAWSSRWTMEHLAFVSALGDKKCVRVIDPKLSANGVDNDSEMTDIRRLVYLVGESKKK